MYGWRKAICETGVFIICAQALIHCRPNGSYEKYLKMLVSAMILMQLVLPLNRFLTGNSAETLEERIRWFQEQLQEVEQQMPEMDEREYSVPKGSIDKVDKIEIAPVVWGEKEGADE